MASLLNSLRRLGAIVGGRRKRSRATTRHTAARRLPGARLQGLESLEERTLLSVAAAVDEQRLALSSPVGSEPAPLSRLIVRFDDAVALESAGRIAADLGAALLREIPSIHGAVIEVNTAGQELRAAMSAAVATWSVYPGVRYAEADGVVHIDATIPNDARFSELWGMNNTGQGGGVADADIDAPEAWDIFRGSNSVVVADIDTGVDYTHPDLAANMWVNPGEIAGNGRDDDGNGWVDDVYGIDAANNDSDPMDDNGHGTHTAGTFGAVGNNGVGVVGVNWNVKIMALKFLDSFGSGQISDAITAIDYMTTMKTRYGINIVVSNNSWGWGPGYFQAMYDAIKASNDAGIMFVAAAGNSGYDNDMWPSYPSSFNLPGIIAVAATDPSDRLASFSQYGRTSVDLGAPGVNILSTVPAAGLLGSPSRYASLNGTSMATPHVTGAVALGMAYEPGSSLDYIKQLILNTVDVVPDLVNRTVTGGRLNLNRFVSSFNQAPVLNVVDTMTLRAVRQEDVTNFGTRITTMLQSLGTDPITDPNANAKEGVAVIAASTTQGAWEYTTNNGATWKALGKVSNASARLLAADTATRIRFVPNPGFTGLVAPAITFRAWDQTSGANGGVGNATKNGGRTAFSSATASASITVTPVTHAPVLNTSLTLSLSPIDEDVADAANAGTLLRDVLLASGGRAAITDADADPQGIAITGADETHGFWQYWLDDVLRWQNVVDPAAGSPSISQALLLPSDDATRLRFVPDPGFHGTVAAGRSFRAWDQSSDIPGARVNTTEAGGQTAFSRDISSASITVRWINEAPFLEFGASLEMTSIDEDGVANPGTRITDILAINFGTPITDNDADMSPGVGIAVVQADETYGAWDYTTNGSDWQRIVGVLSDAGALLLAADGVTRLRFVPGPDFNFNTPNRSIPTITFRAWDRTSGTNGGTGNASINGNPWAFSTNTGTVSILVNSVNDAPRFAVGPLDPVLEDSGAQLVPGLVTAIAPPSDETGQTVWFDVVANDNIDLFLVEPVIDPLTGDLTYTPAPDAFGIANVTIQARDYDGTGNHAISDGQTFTITVEGVNDAPRFEAGPDQVADENSPRQVVPGWATQISCGWGESGQDLWFVVEDNSNPELFAELPAVSPDGTLTYRVAPDANGSAGITVILQDGAGTANSGKDTSDPRTFQIVVMPINAKPVAFEQKDLVTDANQPLAIALTGDDGDPEDQQLTFAIVNNPTKGTITGFNPATGGLVYRPNPGAKGTDTFTFTVTDDATAGDLPGLTSDPATVQIRVDPVVEVPAGPGSNNLVLRLFQGRLQLDLTAGRAIQRLFNEPLSTMHKLTILGAAANPDQLTVDFAAGGSFTLPDGLVFDGLSDGVDTLWVRGTSRSDVFALESDRLTANELSVPFQNVGQVRLDGGAGNDSYAIAALDVPVRIADSSGVDLLDFSAWTHNSGIGIDLGLSKGQPQQVSNVAGTLALVGTIENLIGSPLDDLIKGNAAANRLWGGLGNDAIYGLAGNDLLYGEDGDDFLYGGVGTDVLLGGLGNDSLNAGAGRSILIGGAGQDVLQGSAGESIFIGGATAYDNDDAALMAIVAEWGSRRTFTDRVNRLRNGVGSDRLILLRLNATVIDDLVQDRMIGGRAIEWFMAFADDSVEKSGSGDITGALRAARY